MLGYLLAAAAAGALPTWWICALLWQHRCRRCLYGIPVHRRRRSRRMAQP
jgi:hypothetical protein